MWSFLVQHAKDYGFLGPIVGIAGLFMGAGSALLFGFTRSVSIFKPPPDMLVAALVRVVTLLCAIGIFVAWFVAEPSNGQKYLSAAIRLAVVCVVAFLAYVGLQAYCGRFRKTTTNAQNQPGDIEVIWGGFWLTSKARSDVSKGDTVEAVLAGYNYDASSVWPPASRALATILAALFLLAILVGGTSALSTAATAAQVALTKKPAREVFSSSQVPGLPDNPRPSPTR